MALNTPYKRINPNSINYAAVGQRDPWFALGYALGEGYWNNYNARGIKKGIEEGEKILANGFPKSEPAPQDLVDQAMTISVGKEKVSSEDVEKASNKDSDKTIKPEVDHALMKWDYIQNKYKDNPNPVGDRISTNSIVNNAEVALDNPNVAGMDWNVFASRLDKELTLSGKNAYQRDVIREHIKPLFEAKKSEYNQKASNELYGLYVRAMELGDYASAERFGMQLSSINPVFGNHLLKNTITAKDIWKANNDKEIAHIKANGKKGKSGISSSSNYLNPTSKNDLGLAVDITKNPDKYTPDQQAKAMSTIDFVQKWGHQGLDLNDPHAVSEYLDDVRARASSDLEAAQILWQDGFIAKHPYARELIAEAGMYMPSDFGENGRWMSKYDDDTK